MQRRDLLFRSGLAVGAGAIVAPYATRYARFSGSLLTNPVEIDTALAAFHDLA